MQSDATSSLETLSRLASKPGVQSTLILSKVDGTIIQSSGLRADRQVTASVPEDGRATSLPGPPNDSMDERSASTEETSAEHIAKLVFAYVSSAVDLSTGIEQGNEVQLLRLRTRKNEIVIYPVRLKVPSCCHSRPSKIYMSPTDFTVSHDLPQGRMRILRGRSQYDFGTCNEAVPRTWVVVRGLRESYTKDRPGYGLRLWIPKCPSHSAGKVGPSGKFEIACFSSPLQHRTSQSMSGGSEWVAEGEIDLETTEQV